MRRKRPFIPVTDWESGEAKKETTFATCSLGTSVAFCSLNSYARHHGHCPIPSQFPRRERRGEVGHAPLSSHLWCHRPSLQRMTSDARLMHLRRIGTRTHRCGDYARRIRVDGDAVLSELGGFVRCKRPGSSFSKIFHAYRHTALSPEHRIWRHNTR